MTKKTHGKTITDVEITDELIDQWATEAEAGYDVTKLRPVGRPAMGEAAAIGVHLRLEPELHRDLARAATEAHLSASEVMRRALRAYLKAAS